MEPMWLPVLVPVLLSAGMLHIVMGYCEGGDLCSRLKTYQGQLLPEVQVVEWFVQIALALQVGPYTLPRVHIHTPSCTSP